MKRTYLFFLFLILGLTVHAQQQNGTPQDKLVKVIPPSPEAASLGKFGDIPVGLSTGTPQINIPIYDLVEKDIKLPISLSYHCGGVRVSEVPSCTGLGWSLNAGGVITRSVRGNPDESNVGYFLRDSRIAPLTIPLPSGQLTSQQYTSLENLAYGRTDVEPDLFVFNFGGRSGKFFFDHNQNIHMVSPEDIKIEHAADFSTWKITDESGNQYFFEVTEMTTSTSSDPNADPETFISSWYLTKIISAKGNQVDLHYTSGGWISQGEMQSEYDFFRDIPQVLPEVCYLCETKNNLIQRSFSHEEILTQRLVSIESSNAIVYFDRSATSREDFPGDYALTDIRIFSKSANSVINKYHLNYSYFIGNGVYGFTLTGINQPSLNKRLKLLSIDQYPAENGPQLLPVSHTFYYDETQLPARTSWAQDHWGFYNGALTNQTMLPKTSNLSYGIIWGDRNSNGNYMNAGSLIKIQYPTGGNTQFEYEANKTTTTETVFNNLTQQISMYGQPGGYQESRTFTIDYPQFCQVIWQVTYGNYPMENIAAHLVITDANNNVVLERIGPGNLTTTDWFYPGTYTMTMTMTDTPESYQYVEFNYKSGPVYITTIKDVGGMRLKKMTDFDVVANISHIKKYQYSDAFVTGPKVADDYLSPHYERAPYNEYCNGDYFPPPPPHLQNEYICGYLGRSSFPKYSFGSVTGGHVAYSTVTELYGNNGENGKSEYTFGFEPPSGGGPFPYPPATIYEDRNGLLLSKKDYNSAGTLLSQSNSSYTYDTKYSELSMKTGFLYDDPFHDSYNMGIYHDQIRHEYFTILSENAKKTSDGVTQYSTSGNGSISSGTSQYYDNPSHNFPTRTESVNSKGETIKEIIKYPKDYTAGGFIQTLVNMNLIGVPIEKYTIRKMPNGQEFVIAGGITIFEPGKAVPDKLWQLETSTPVSLASFMPSQMDGSGNFTKDSRYTELVSFTQYDTYSNLREQSKTGDVKHAYIWDYSSNFPVAECVNADMNSAAFTSFESNGTGGWNLNGIGMPDPTAITGKKSCTTNGLTASKTGLSASSTYIVSYWSKGGQQTVSGTASVMTGRTYNGWTYYEHKVVSPSEGTITLTGVGSGYIDELRLFPEKAQMISYTYEPLIGITTLCDPNSRISYYEYDPFNRLTLVRDQDNNILKKICYNYAGQPENCTGSGCTNTTANWQNTSTALRCQQGACGNTGYQEQEQKDMNPCSPTYNQIHWIVTGFNPTACVPGSTAPNWQNTSTPIRCQVNASGCNTGYQEQEQRDMNTCSATYNQTQWINTGYNSTACPPTIPISYQISNSLNISGFTASYYNQSTTQTYNFMIPANGSGILGCLPAGIYNLTISKPGNNFIIFFDIGCRSASATSVFFKGISVNSGSCDFVHLDFAM